MLEGLQAWVAEADGRMTETEATPIGTDIETVERQLANHEVGTITEATPIGTDIETVERQLANHEVGTITWW